MLSVLIILAAAFLRTASPCQEPMTYRIGKVDERFGLTRQEFAIAVDMAASMWGKPLSHELFREDHNGAIAINLVYDYRQEATDNLKKLNFEINNTKDSFGHALGLNHSKSAEAVMSPLIQSDSPVLAADDIAALKGHCKIH